MSVLTQIESDLVVAMKQHESELVSILRMLKSALKNAEIENKGELTEQKMLAILEKQSKQRLDAAKQFTVGGRADLSEKEQSEAAIIAKYLPAKLDEAALAAIVDTAIAETGATSLKDMGQVIAAVMANANGAADGAMVAAIVKSKLQ